MTDDRKDQPSVETLERVLAGLWALALPEEEEPEVTDDPGQYLMF